MPKHLARIALIAAAVCAATPLAASDEGWVITRFTSLIDLDRAGAFIARESIDADFGAQTKHGIFRDVVFQQIFDRRHVREYPMVLLQVTDANGRPQTVEASTAGTIHRFRIGDANRTVSGVQTYRIAYQVQRALNGFADHDEL